MKAGQALGLLAGMGALSALGRGTDLQGNRFTGLLDMIDGGGGGKSGDRFQGGGLLSILGNLFAKPYEAQKRVEDIANRASARSVTPQPNMTTGTPITEYSDSLLAPIVNEDVYGVGNAGEYGGVPSVTPDVYNIGSADMPPELLPMTTLSVGSARRGTLGDDVIQNSAFQQLFNRSVAEGYRGADMPSYIAEKKLIEMAKYPNSEYSNNMIEADYASLMPPSLMRQAAGTPTAPYEQAPMRQAAGTPTAPYESNEAFRQQAIQLYGQGFLNLTPTSQARIIEGLRLGASRSAY